MTSYSEYCSERALEVAIAIEEAKPKKRCPPGECVCTDVTLGNVFMVYRCVRCGQEEWL